MAQVYFFPACSHGLFYCLFLLRRGRKGDSGWRSVPKVTSSQLRIPCCQIAGMFLLRVWFSFLFFLSFIFFFSVEHETNETLSMLRFHSFRFCAITYSSQMGCFLPSKVPPISSCPLSPAYSADSIILYSTPRKINQITTS